MIADLRHAARMLLKQPAFTAVAVLTLALGIGANTAIFSVVNAVLLRPLPYKNPDQLVAVYEKRVTLGRERNAVSAPDFIDWRAQNTVFENTAAYASWSANETSGDEPQRLVATLASADLFPALGVSPALGRAFTGEEDLPGTDRVVVLSHAFWQQRFGARASILGKPITLNGNKFIVVGVMPRGFHFPDKETQLWAPLAIDPANTGNRAQHGLSVVARLKSGTSLEKARSEMVTIARRLEQQHQVNTGHSVNLFPLHSEIVGPIRPALLVLIGAVGFVLLIAGVNVANLLLVRLAGRQKEIAIRTALGASRSRIVRQFLSESLLLSLLGGACGLLLAVWGTDVLIAMSPANTPRVHEVKVDGVVLAFTLAVSLLPGFFFGFLPALQLSQTDVTHGLKEGGRTGSSDVRSRRVRGALVIAEVASALVLLVGAGLLMKSFVRLRATDSGLHPAGVLTAQISLPRGKYGQPQQQAAFTQEIIQRLQNAPGVTSAGAVVGLPLSGAPASRYFSVEGRPPTRPGEGSNAQFNIASPGYFETVGIPLLRGRLFSERDLIGQPEVAVINEALARKFFPDDDPIGKRVQIGDQPWHTIVGIVGNVRQTGLHTEPAAEFYQSLLQDPLPFMALVVRSQRDPRSLATDLRSV
ncbi:MAG: ABC transporter permease, partial [Verrucomicrobiota bacterium]|nr:ABC transporter permease [Verrucomicrobiota bacterium]